MKSPRLTLKLWVGALLAIATACASCGGGAEEAGGDRLRRPLAIPVLDQVRSGELELTLSFENPEDQERLDMRLLGTFLGAGGEGLPLVDFAAEANGTNRGEEVDFDTALIATRDRAVLTYDGETYETDRRAFEALEETFGSALGRGGAGDIAACLEAAGRIEVDRLTTRVIPPAWSRMFDETAVRTTKADLRGGALAGALRQLREDPGCGAQLRAAGSLARLLREVEEGLRREGREAEGTLAVDKTGTMRELSAHVVLQSHQEGRREAALQIRLMRVNEITELPPCHGERPLAALFHRLGFNPLAPIESDRADGLIGLLEGMYGQGRDGRGQEGLIARSGPPA